MQIEYLSESVREPAWSLYSETLTRQIARQIRRTEPEPPDAFKRIASPIISDRWILADFNEAAAAADAYACS
jgi:hypothetical protein